MKKTLAVLLALIMLLIVLPARTSADTDFTLVIEGGEASAHLETVSGEECLRVDVFLLGTSEAKQLLSIDFNLQYDENQLIFVKEEAIEGPLCLINGDTAGILYCAFASATGITLEENTPLVSLWFKLADDLANDTTIAFALETNDDTPYASGLVSNTQIDCTVGTDFAPFGFAPSILTQPADVTAVVGEEASFTVEATGGDLTYQWYCKAPDATAWQTISAASGKTATYTLTAEMQLDGYQYCCLVTNPFGEATSDAATLTVDASFEIVTQPTDVTVMAGEQATFTVEAEGGELTYQWYYQKPGETTWNAVLNNGTSASYSLTTAARHNGYQYKCVITNSSGEATSSVVTLTVQSAPTITTQPKSVTVDAGKTATFKVVATGSDLQYQWYYLKPGETTWTAVLNNGTSASYSLTTAARHNGYQYKCIITNQFGEVTSNIVTLTVQSAPTITTQPKSVTVDAGKTATFKVVATGSDLQYQWYYLKPSETTWTAVSAAAGKTATYSFTTAARHNGYKYKCIVTNAAGSVTSSIATLTVASKPTITTQPTNKTVTAGATATFKVIASGSDLTYQWYYQKPGETTWTAVSAAAGKTATYSFTTAARHNGYKYKCVVKNSFGEATSNVVTLTVQSAPTITTQPANKTVTAGATATFKVVASGSNLTYQWYYQKPGETTWNAVLNNGTSATYSLTTAARHNGYKYKCLVKNSLGQVYTKVVTLTVNN